MPSTTNTISGFLNRSRRSVEVWVSESGSPLVGAAENEAVPSVANAQQYWDTVVCAALKLMAVLFGKVMLCRTSVQVLPVVLWVVNPTLCTI